MLSTSLKRKVRNAGPFLVKITIACIKLTGNGEGIKTLQLEIVDLIFRDFPF